MTPSKKGPKPVPVKCPNCPKIFPAKWILKNHIIRRHEENGHVKCEICRKVLKHRLSLYQHMWGIHRRRDKSTCNICQRQYSTRHSLNSHMRHMHRSGEKPRLPCKFAACEKTFKTRGEVTLHFKIEHVENPIRFPCTLCGREFKVKGNRDAHIASHTKEKVHKCDTCGKYFQTKSGLKFHKVVHEDKSDRQMFKCSFCQKAFLTNKGLEMHIRNIHGDRRDDFPCPNCDKVFANKSNLKRHLKASHLSGRVPWYSCDRCGYKTRDKSHLARHLTRTTDCTERKNACYFCGVRFTSNAVTWRHMGKMHKVR